MQRVRRDPDRLIWPSWRYGPNGESGIFKCPEEVPEGWVRRPGDIPPPFIPRQAPEVLDREELLRQLDAKGVHIDYTWGVAQMKKVLDS